MSLTGIPETEVIPTTSSPTDPPWTHYRAVVAALSRSRRADDPELVAARSAMKETKLADHIRRVVDGAPPLTEAQRATLAALLSRGVR